VRFGNDPRWCSYRQAQARGWQVRAGERGRVIVFYKRIQKGAETREDGTIPYFQLLRFSTVFHASQMDGVPDYHPPELGSVPWQTPAPSTPSSKIAVWISDMAEARPSFHQPQIMCKCRRENLSRVPRPLPRPVATSYPLGGR